MSENVTWHEGLVTSDERRRLLGHGASVLWLTGLSGSGKSTLARQIEQTLVARGVLAYVLDGDNLRHGLSSDLGFSAEDRRENIRRVAEASRLLLDAGVLVLTAFISPFREDRDRARAIIGDERFLEIFVATPIEVCEARDPKGLYRRARAGEIRDFTGLGSPYEPPGSPALVVGADGASVEVSAHAVIALLEARGVLDPR